MFPNGFIKTGLYHGYSSRNAATFLGIFICLVSHQVIIVFIRFRKGNGQSIIGEILKLSLEHRWNLIKAYKMQNHLLKVTLVKNCPEMFRKFHRKEPLMKSFISLLKKNSITFLQLLTLFRKGLLGTAHGWSGAKRPSLSKICQTYPTMMKLGTALP